MGLNFPTQASHRPQLGFLGVAPRRRASEAAVAISAAVGGRDQIIRHPRLAILAQATLIPLHAEGLLSGA